MEYEMQNEVLMNKDEEIKHYAIECDLMRKLIINL